MDRTWRRRQRSSLPLNPVGSLLSSPSERQEREVDGLWERRQRGFLPLNPVGSLLLGSS